MASTYAHDEPIGNVLLVGNLVAESSFPFVYNCICLSTVVDYSVHYTHRIISLSALYSSHYFSQCFLSRFPSFWLSFFLSFLLPLFPSSSLSFFLSFLLPLFPSSSLSSFLSFLLSYFLAFSYRRYTGSLEASYSTTYESSCQQLSKDNK
eukprot:GHVU01220323.1.p1 GENE.GHVU01220323.1~~GHVU01220323.1.p1  ORF type:complete len:150 (+),score=0.75 GHVU01220323.1:715-1164(+)